MDSDVICLTKGKLCEQWMMVGVHCELTTLQSIMNAKLVIKLTRLPDEQVESIFLCCG